jgi:hypothetical protein
MEKMKLFSTLEYRDHHSANMFVFFNMMALPK